MRVAGTVKTGRGLALGLVVSAYAIGTAVLAPVAASLLGAVGRSWTFVVLAAILGVVLLAAAVLLPDEAASAATTETRPDDQQTPRGPAVVLWLAFGLGSAPALAAFAHAGQLAGSTAVAAVAVTLLDVGNFVGRLAAGTASDRAGRRATLHANSALLVLACLPLAVGVTGAVALVALFLLGTQYGALSTLTPAALSDVVPGSASAPSTAACSPAGASPGCSRRSRRPPSRWSPDTATSTAPSSWSQSLPGCAWGSTAGWPPPPPRRRSSEVIRRPR